MQPCGFLQGEAPARVRRRRDRATYATAGIATELHCGLRPFKNLIETAVRRYNTLFLIMGYTRSFHSW